MKVIPSSSRQRGYGMNKEILLWLMILPLVYSGGGSVAEDTASLPGGNLHYKLTGSERNGTETDQ